VNVFEEEYAVEPMFPKPDETVMDIANEMRRVHVKDEIVYEIVEAEIPAVVDVSSEQPQRVVTRHHKQTLKTLGDRLEAACKRRKDEVARLWNALDDMARWMNHTMLGSNGDALLNHILEANDLKREGAAK